MRRAIVSIALTAGLLFASASPASAAPRYGRDWTTRNGWVVEVRNDGRWSRIHCEWTAGGQQWHLNWTLRPYEYEWTTSDAGQWGDRRPQGLFCSYRRI